MSDSEAGPTGRNVGVLLLLCSVVRVGTADLSAESHQGGSRDAEERLHREEGGAGPLFPLRPQESSRPESQRLRTERQTGKESRPLRRSQTPEQREGGGKHQHLTNA